MSVINRAIVVEVEARIYLQVVVATASVKKAVLERVKIFY